MWQYIVHCFFSEPFQFCYSILCMCLHWGCFGIHFTMPNYHLLIRGHVHIFSSIQCVTGWILLFSCTCMFTWFLSKWSYNFWLTEVGMDDTTACPVFLVWYSTDTTSERRVFFRHPRRASVIIIIHWSCTLSYFSIGGHLSIQCVLYLSSWVTI